MPHLIDGAALARAWAQANKESSTEPDTGPLSDFGTLSDFVDAPNRPLIVSPAWPKFSFSFQPIVNTTTGRIHSFEALVRGSKNESAGHVFSRVPKMDMHRFDEILRARALPLAASLGLDCNINLNVLPLSLQSTPTAIASTIAAARNAGIPNSRLSIEITESECISDVENFTKTINEYRKFGINISIDDFGAGYAGLNLLAEFQPDSIKLDMALIQKIDTHGPRQAIVRGVLRTCQDLGIEIIAEGVETQREFEWCRDEGVELFQGYYFAKPSFESLPLAYYPAFDL
jgi:blue light- and temperature-responsive anti-repressor